MSRSSDRFLGGARGPLALLIALLVALGIAPLQAPQSAEALSGSSFDARYIISDSQFYSTDAMSEAEIQAFLNSKVASCGNANCLRNVRVDTYSRAADNPMCAAYQGAAQESAARIIFKVQQACGISAKVILVTLQKEQSLITSSSPSNSTLGRAMGYGCPDSAGGACDAEYFGLYNQVYKAAWQLKRYSAPGRPLYYYQPGPPQPIAFHPNSACGSVGIAIRNFATAALYNYTPYVPNYAALGNLGGVGDACSSYGNRNFWAYYSNWFGSPTSISTDVVPARITGVDRFDTSAQLAQRFETATTVYIANGLNFPDALSGGAAAVHAGAPMLLVAPTAIPAAVRTEIVRLSPTKIVVLGGEDSVSTAVFTDLQGLAAEVVRYQGIDRYGTSLEVAKRVFAEGATPLAYIATGEGFADALSASAVAGSQGAPVLLVRGSSPTLDQATRDTLAYLGVTRVIVAGGPTTVSAGIVTALTGLPGMTVERITGLNRYETASALTRDFFTSSPTIIVASGRSFPDALSGAALAGHLGVALLISEPTCLFRQTVQDMLDLGMTKMYILGGNDTLAPSVESYLNCD